MGVDLHRKENDAYDGEEDFHANWQGWWLLLSLAHDGGWEPKWTTRYGDDGSVDPAWNGGYDSNDAQYVTREDASAIADAIGRAKGVSDFHAKTRGFIEAFVAYCRGGGFEIW